MSNKIELDSCQTLETLFKRDYDTSKFLVAMFLDGDSSTSTYISGDLSDIELTYLIQHLKDRREALFNDD